MKISKRTGITSDKQKEEISTKENPSINKYSELVEVFPFAIIEIVNDELLNFNSDASDILGINSSSLPINLKTIFNDAELLLNQTFPKSISLHLLKSKTTVHLTQLISFSEKNCVYDIKRDNDKKIDAASEKTKLEELVDSRTMKWQRSEARLRLLLQSVPIAFYSFEKNNRKDIWYSEHIEYMSGFSIAELKNNPNLWEERINASDFSMVGGTFDKLKKPNQRAACEYRWLDAKNQEIWIYDQAILIEATKNHPQQIIGCFMDISERKQAEIAILESERNYTEIFNSSSNAITIQNAQTGKMEDVNETMLTMFGITYEDALTLDFDQFSLGKPPYDKANASKKLEKALIKNRISFEWQARKADGTVFWIDVILKTIILNGNAKIMAVLRDISQQKKDEEQILYRSAFEKLILDISSRFINMPYQEVDAGIEHALKEICGFSQTSSGYLFLFNDVNDTSNITHVWKNDKIDMKREHLLNVPLEASRWHRSQIKNQKVIKVKTLDEIPDTERELKYIIRQQNVNSFIDVPLIYQNNVIGFLGIAVENEGREWLDDEISLLKIIGQTFVNAIKRKESVQTILESEQTHREIYNATNEAIIVHEIDTGKFLDVNNAFLVMYGFEYNEAIQTSFADISSNEGNYTQEDALQFIRKTLKEGPQVIEWQARRKDQSLIWVEISMKTADIGGTKRILSVIRDITDRKEAVEQLKINEEKYRLLVESQTDLIVKIDPDGNFLFVSQSYCDLFGKSEDELIGTKFMPLVHKDDLASTIKAMEKLYQPPYTCYIEQRALTVSGWRWIAWSDKAILNNKNEVIEIIGVGRDMTYQKGVEEALLRSEDRFRSIVQQLSDIIFICDKDTNIIYDTPSIKGILGYPEGFLVGGKILSIIHPEEVDYAREKLSDLKKESSKTLKTELRIKNSNGEFIPMEAVAINLLQHQNIQGIVITLRDINERKMLDKKILDAVINTEEQERERFAKNLHDDLGPLLSSIKMYINSFSSSSNPEKQEYIISQLNEIVKEAITTTKDVSNDLSPHILINYGLVSAIENFIKKVPLSVEVNLESSLTSQRYSNSIENSFYRIVKELINNTLKHANAKKIEIQLAENGQELSLTYFDNGKGINWSGKNPEESKGMGISNIISRAKSLNGKYNFQPQKRSGFSFTISIPIHQSLD